MNKNLIKYIIATTVVVAGAWSGVEIYTLTHQVNKLSESNLDLQKSNKLLSTQLSGTQEEIFRLSEEYSNSEAKLKELQSTLDAMSKKAQYNP